jgi:hypothetical protein
MAEALSKPRNLTHTMYKLNDWLLKGVIDLSPEFQRGIFSLHFVITFSKKKCTHLILFTFFFYCIIEIVWTGKKQSHLIDSVINNYYIPPIIFSCKRLDNGRWVRVCIDGKQRLTAIKK